jgi:catalase
MNTKVGSSGNINGLALMVLGVTTCLSSSVLSAEEPRHESSQDLVNALHTAFGEHHARAVHAKGILLEGSFTPAPGASKLSKATLFSGATVPVTVRFSDFTGIPDIPDTIGDANPRGFAVKFRLADGKTVDIINHSFNGFPVANADEFATLLRAIGTSGAGVAKPTPLDDFLASHPIAKTFLTTQKPAPVSYATLAYYGVNAFKYTNAKGKASYVRYRFVPAAGEQFLDAQALKSKGPDYLQDEIAARVDKGAIAYDWYAQIAISGDIIGNPSIAWPENRALVKLGTIRIVRVTPEQPTADKATAFMPGNLQPGIEPADPMIQRRNDAYPISFRARQ